MYAIRVNENTRVNQVSSRTHPVRSDSNLIGFFIGVNTMKQIPLTQGKFALVDDEYYKWLNQWKWWAVKGTNTWYAVRNVYHNGIKTNIRMHREILGLESGDPREGDHCNHNGLDNRLGNLRICTPSQNQHNRRPNKNCFSAFKGVGWHKGGSYWQARIRFNGNLKHLGCFASEIEAAKAYNQKAIELFGKYAYLNSMKVRIL